MLMWRLRGPAAEAEGWQLRTRHPLTSLQPPHPPLLGFGSSWDGPSGAWTGMPSLKLRLLLMRPHCRTTEARLQPLLPMLMGAPGRHYL